MPSHRFNSLRSRVEFFISTFFSKIFIPNRSGSSPRPPVQRREHLWNYLHISAPLLDRFYFLHDNKDKEDHREQQHHQQRSNSPRAQWMDLQRHELGCFLLDFSCLLGKIFYFSSLYDSFVRYVLVHTTSLSKVFNLPKFLIDNECWHVLVHTNGYSSSATLLVWTATLWI